MLGSTLILAFSLKGETSCNSVAQEIVSRIEVHEYKSGAIVEVKYDPKSNDVAVVGINN